MTAIEIAARYGVKLQYSENLPQSASGSPRGPYACDPKARIVYVRAAPCAPPAENEATLLHEIVHCIVQPPGYSIFTVPEGWLLLPFERQLFRFLPIKARREARLYQEGTELGVLGYDETLLMEVEHFRNARFWRKGLRRARELDLLDSNNRVTWRWPKWKSRSWRRDLKKEVLPL